MKGEMEDCVSSSLGLIRHGCCLSELICERNTHRGDVSGHISQQFPGGETVKANISECPRVFTKLILQC